MKINKIYSFSNGAQLWRIIPDENGRLIVETRDTNKKEVSFNCLEIETGKYIFRDLQLEEKFWIGIEAVHRNFIVFHKFTKPDMPGHKGIIVYDIDRKEIAWETNEYAFLFSTEEKIYCFKQKFETRDYFALDVKTGKTAEYLESEYETVNKLRYDAEKEKDYSGYKFPKIFHENETDLKVKENILNVIEGIDKEGPVEFVKYDDHLLFNYHENKGAEGLQNILRIIDLKKNEEVKKVSLNINVNAYAPDSFFIKDNFLFTLIEKTRLDVYKLGS